jgi:hypothetical protein
MSPDDTLTALVKELQPKLTCGEVIREIEHRRGRPLRRRQRRTVIEMYSRQKNWGSTQHVAAPPTVLNLMIPEDTRLVYSLHAETRHTRLHEIILCVLEWIANEDLIDVLCPPVGSV